MPANIGNRYTRDHVVVRNGHTYEELNSPCETAAEAKVQNALLRRARRPPKGGLLYVVLAVAVLATLAVIGGRA